MDVIAACMLIYIVIPGILFISCRKKVDEDILNRDTTESLKGILVVYVAIHHYVLQLNNTTHLKPMIYIGFLPVAFFFFMSGYGLVNSNAFLNKEKLSFIKFIQKRIGRLYLPFFIGNIIVGILYNIFMMSNYSFSEIIITSLTMRTIYSKTILWYILVQALMYLIFLCSFSLFNSSKLRTISILTFTLLYIVFAKWLAQGEWRYNSVICFPLGVWTACNKKRVLSILKHKVKGNIIVLLMLIFFICMGLVVNTFDRSYLKSFLAILFVILLTIFTYKFKVTSRVYRFIGTISYEFYILQLPVVYIVVHLVKDTFGGLLITILMTIILSIVDFKIVNSFKSAIRSLLYNNCWMKY